MKNRYGLTGKNVTVAVLDTGISPHIDFDNRIMMFRDYVYGKTRPYDDNGHGTHVAGIIGGSGRASEGKYEGVAPGCNLVVLKILDRKGNGRRQDIISAIEWVRKMRKTYGIRIMNISVGTTEQDRGLHDLLIQSVEAAWDDGITVITAAGNLGPGPGTVTAPGSSRKVITVGSSDLMDPQNGISGRGPTRECVCKPDLVAPGKEIISCAPGRSHREYAVKSGTSMSTPMISGAAALVLERTSELTNVQIKMLLCETAKDLGLPHNQQGWGLFDFQKFLQYAVVRSM
ncbi:MAG: S8 family peptidase [Fusicatenibacter sp.]|nr:S8 family peptidase [Lachnospiraceae bacterium]MDY2939233.1 S8 family peptidase [Fusicatenibacter sp.]